MGVRRQAREIALQVIYSLEFRDRLEPDEEIFTLPEVMPLFLTTNEEVKAYASILVKGVLTQKNTIDRYLSLSSQNWSLYRMARVDRAILRIGTYEMLACSDVPPYVAIDEAIEISKIYSSDEAPMFINGVLDRVAGLLETESRLEDESLVTQILDEKILKKATS